ncbi:nucleoside diphosphate-linked moiety X motif 17 isoform X1 [Dromaius novaehollandiae]|uniref:nucleoside diphosphate-linked moiety X motif 17 isoform X1 n=1 Tax=Dromaius novaehollandiae TaxID=8790 RepID=UPI00311FBE6B
MAGLAHVLVHVRRGGVEGPARFGQSVTGAFCAANEDAATVSCRLERGRLILADAAFPGSTETLLERPPGCPAKLLGQQPAAPGTPGPRGVAAAVAVLLQASTRRVLLTRRAAALAGFPDTWVPPAAGHGAAGAGGGDGPAPGSRHLLLEDARPLGVRLPPRAEPGATAAPPRRRLPAAALRREPRAAAGQDAAGREGGERLRVAGAAGAAAHRRPGRGRGHPARCRQHHGAARRLGPRHRGPSRRLPGRRRGRRRAGQRRHQVRPPALAGGGRGAGRALGRHRAAPGAAHCGRRNKAASRWVPARFPAPRLREKRSGEVR